MIEKLSVQFPIQELLCGSECLAQWLLSLEKRLRSRL